MKWYLSVNAMLCNMQVQRHYAGVQALALLEDFDDGSYDEHTVDATLPDVEGMKKRVRLIA